MNLLFQLFQFVSILHEVIVENKLGQFVFDIRKRIGIIRIIFRPAGLKHFLFFLVLICFSLFFQATLCVEKLFLLFQFLSILITGISFNRTCRITRRSPYVVFPCFRPTVFPGLPPHLLLHSLSRPGTVPLSVRFERCAFPSTFQVPLPRSISV